MYSILKFGATWCGPCQELTKQLADKPLEGIEIKEFDIDDNERLVDAFNITNVPTLIIMKDSHVEVARHEGFMTPEQIVEWYNTNTHE